MAIAFMMTIAVATADETSLAGRFVTANTMLG